MSDILPPYPAYKDSDVPWLGRIPAHWEVQRQRNVVDMLVSNIDKHTVEGQVPVRLCNYVDVYKNERITERLSFMRATASPDDVKRFRLQVGDVVITKDSEMWNDIGVPALVEYAAPDLVCGYHLVILRPRRGIVYGSYLLRALQSQGIASQHYVSANGVTRFGLSHDAIKSVLVPLPPLPEQHAITRYLDYMDRRIRRIIRAKQKLIALLEEQKQAIIHQAVTKGLDPSVRLKPSGVAWLGDVPEHWEILALKRVLRRLIDCEHKTAPAVENSEFRVVRTTAVRNGKLRLEGTYCTTAEAFAEWTWRGTPEVGDVIFTREAPAGEACLVPLHYRVCLGQRTVLMKLKLDRYEPSFLVHMIYGGPPANRIRLASRGSTVDHFNMADIAELTVLVPSLAEQQTIVVAIDSWTKPLEDAMAGAAREIALLREYRTRLLADVVTGQVDVRAAAAQLPEETEETDVLEDVEELAEDEEGEEQMDEDEEVDG
jgi:type I restriction enzyme S subunit